MSALVNQAPRFAVSDAARLAEEQLGIEATAESLSSERNQNFLLRTASGERFILKIANAEEQLDVLDLENQTIDFLAKHCPGLKFPFLVASPSGQEIVKLETDQGRTHYSRLLTWVEGTSLVDLPCHSPELLNSLGRALAQIDRTLAEFEHPAAQRILHWDLRYASLARPHARLLPEPRRALVEACFAEWEKIDWDSLRFGVIHGDANDHNVLAEGDRVVSVLDCGDVTYTAIVCDLAIALAYVMLEKRDPIASAAKVIRSYHEVFPLTDAEAQVLYTLALTRLTVSVCYSAYHAVEAPQNEYLQVTSAPAWRLLERLADFPEGWAAEVFRDACRAGTDSKSDTVLTTRQKHLGPSLSLSYHCPLHIVRGWRQRLYDSEGRAYLDCVNNVAHVGHCHPAVVKAASEQMARLNTNTRYLYDRLTDYLERLTAMLPDPLNVVYLVCSGSEANELALRLARAHTRRDNLIVVDAAYHGNTSSLVDISPYKFNGPGGRRKPARVSVVPMPDVYRGAHRGNSAGPRYADYVAAISAGNAPAAFIVESGLSCGGQIILPEGYLAAAFQAVRSARGVCIADEVQTGFGRVGSHFWMFETQEVVPDIVTLGKPIGNGHPIGAVITTPEIAASFANGMEYFNTFGGNPVSCAVGLAVLDVIRDEGLQENARTTGTYLLEGLRQLAERHPLIGDVRGQGLFLGIELVRDRDTLEPAASEAAEIVEGMKDRGMLLSTDGPFHNVIKIKPPMVFSRKDADSLVEGLDSVLSQRIAVSRR